MKLDSKGYLKTNPFDYQINKNGSVQIFWEGKHIKTLAGKEASKFQAKAERLSQQDLQLYLAKLTGNFKRGNERSNKS